MSIQALNRNVNTRFGLLHIPEVCTRNHRNKDNTQEEIHKGRNKRQDKRDATVTVEKLQVKQQVTNAMSAQ